MKYAAVVRKELGMKTVFNLLEPYQPCRYQKPVGWGV
ncbi:MAG: hypothetical protein IPG53_05990 [Ignavibacteriales bacterium]|nr:hypothetical protein [Ignavibacteriales bacterium]